MQYDSSKDYFQYAEDLVRYIRDKYGDYFCICVAGYPAMHVESKNREEDLYYLKRKVDAGADFIITQLFYDPDEFLEFSEACQKYDINVPILPGILPVQNYNSFKRIINLCRIKIPDELAKRLEEVKSNDEKVKEIGIDHCINMCKKLLNNGVLGLHFYTMNLEKSVSEVIKQLELKVSSKVRELPWKKYSNPKRLQENVRPIFWKNNAKSYLSKTWYWDEFPNGIWGDSRSPAFGNLSEHFVSFCKDYIKESKKFKNLKKMWGDKLNSLEDVSKVFLNYINGNIKKLPWCEESELSNEIVYIKDVLHQLNQKNVFTINSQPPVNGKPSNDPDVGWGPADGYVYQRMYIEFFVDKEKLEKLINHLNSYPWITYQAVNKNGQVIQKNENQIVAALTWGVFPNREIIQPTIYDSDVFLVWKDEAFSLWNEWIKIYEEDEEKCAESAELLKNIRDEYYLMTIVDNDYVCSRGEEMLREFLKQI